MFANSKKLENNNQKCVLLTRNIVSHCAWVKLSCRLAILSSYLGHFLSLVSHIGWHPVKGHFVIWREAGEGITSFEAKTEPKHAGPGNCNRPATTSVLINSKHPFKMNTMGYLCRRD